MKIFDFVNFLTENILWLLALGAVIAHTPGPLNTNSMQLQLVK